MTSVAAPSHAPQNFADFAISPHEKALQNDIAAQVEAACERIAPLWPLKNFVAVNPFVGLSSRAFTETCALMRRVTHGDMLMSFSYYQTRYEQGEIADCDLQNALDQARHSLFSELSLAAEKLSVEQLKAALYASNAQTSSTRCDETGAIFTVADVVDELHQTSWRAFVTDEISKWCSAFYDAGQASWRMPWRDQSLFAAWKNAALCDANPEMMGLRGFRKTVASLPDDALSTIEYALGQLQVTSQLSAQNVADFLHRQLMSIAGWSGYVQYLARENGLYGRDDDSLQQLLAIRLVYEVALLQQFASSVQEFWAQNLQSLPERETSPEITARYLWQLAAENAYQRTLIARLRAASENAASEDASATSSTRTTETLSRFAVQSVFCIDVRSEVFRRSLESVSPQIETLGFAGFFGFPIEYVPFGQSHGTTQCPVLLTPPFRIRESLAGASPQQKQDAKRQLKFSKRVGHSWNSFKTSAVSCFSFVETGGLLSGAKLIKDSFGLTPEKSARWKTAPEVQQNVSQNGEVNFGMSSEEQIAVAAGALKNMGLTHNFARLVMICGHGSSTANNPYGSGLDCGACGGHSGEANARVAVAVLNNREVRAGLRERGISVPDDTHFLAALHNTTTDDVTLFDLENIPVSHAQDLGNLQSWLQNASRVCRVHRAPSLGLSLEDSQTHNVDELVRARSRDWAQVRPEWGLAGNAAFIAAPRERTKTLDLGGRTFLNNFEYSNDIDGSVLELIMTAPMIVASWINLQYFASTVNNTQFGSGNKTIHNVVGTIGVWQGNSGDLKVGLPLQSLHDGEKWMHEPLRLSVFIEAPRHAINRVIESHQNVRELLDNGWLHLVCIENNGADFARYCGDLTWKTVEADFVMTEKKTMS